MQKLFYLSKLPVNEKMGGAYLRNIALKELYQSLGMEVIQVHADEIPGAKYNYKSIFQWLKYGLNTRKYFKYLEIDAFGFDVIHLEDLKDCFYKINTSKNCKHIFNAHNIESKLIFTQSDKMKKFLNYESSMLEKFDVILVCSSEDKEVLCNNNPLLEHKIFVFPNLVSKENYLTSPIKYKIGFVGSLDYAPNIEACEFLIENFTQENLSKDILQKYDFYIAGKNPSKNLIKKIDQSIFKLNESPSSQEMKQILSETKLSLVPLSHGSGTRLKIIESVFSGAPVLSTTIGRQGIKGDYIIEVDRDHFTEYINRDQFPIIDKEGSQYTKFCELYDTHIWIKNNKHLFKELFCDKIL